MRRYQNGRNIIKKKNINEGKRTDYVDRRIGEKTGKLTTMQSHS
jgi:hypothetical protein